MPKYGLGVSVSVCSQSHVCKFATNQSKSSMSPPANSGCIAALSLSWSLEYWP